MITLILDNAFLSAIAAAICMAALHMLFNRINDHTETKKIIEFLRTDASYVFRSTHAISAATNLPKARVEALCARSKRIKRNEKNQQEIGRWAIHPGGTKILGSVQKCLELSDADIAHSWEVLSEYGNTLSCAVLFVLERMLYVTSKEQVVNSEIELTRHDSPSAEQASSPYAIALSFSPGVGVEGMLLEFT